MTHMRSKLEHIRRYHDVRWGTFYDCHEGQVVLVLSTRYEGNIYIYRNVQVDVVAAELQ